MLSIGYIHLHFSGTDTGGVEAAAFESVSDAVSKDETVAVIERMGEEEELVAVIALRSDVLHQLPALNLLFRVHPYLSPF